MWEATCSNCGKKIPMAGNVCPYCHVDATKDKQWWAVAYIITTAIVLALCTGCCCIGKITQGH